MAAKDLVEYVAKSLVDNPDAVKVEVIRDPDGTVIELHVAEDDMGKVIGRNGSVAKALRTLLKVTSARDGEPAASAEHAEPRVLAVAGAFGPGAGSQHEIFRLCRHGGDEPAIAAREWARMAGNSFSE